jgi:hypothetical protein
VWSLVSPVPLEPWALTVATQVAAWGGLRLEGQSVVWDSAASHRLFASGGAPPGPMWAVALCWCGLPRHGGGLLDTRLAYVWAAHLLQQGRLALRGFPSGDTYLIRVGYHAGRWCLGPCACAGSVWAPLVRWRGGPRICSAPLTFLVKGTSTKYLAGDCEGTVALRCGYPHRRESSLRLDGWTPWRLTTPARLPWTLSGGR